MSLDQIQTLQNFNELIKQKIQIKEIKTSGGRYFSVNGTTVSFQLLLRKAMILSEDQKKQGLDPENRKEVREIYDNLKLLDRQASKKLKQAKKNSSLIRHLAISIFTGFRRFFGNIFPTLWGDGFNKKEEFKKLKRIAGKKIPTEPRKNPPPPEKPGKKESPASTEPTPPPESTEQPPQPSNSQNEIPIPTTELKNDPSQTHNNIPAKEKPDDRSEPPQDQNAPPQPAHTQPLQGLWDRFKNLINLAKPSDQTANSPSPDTPEQAGQSSPPPETWSHWTQDKVGRIKQLWNGSGATEKPACDPSTQLDMQRMEQVHQLYRGFANGFTCESKEKMIDIGAFFASFVAIDSRARFNSDQDHLQFQQNVLKNLEAFNKQREECVDLSYKASDELLRFIATTFGQDEFHPEHILSAVETTEAAGGKKPQSEAGVDREPRLKHLTKTRPLGPMRKRPARRPKTPAPKVSLDTHEIKQPEQKTPPPKTWSDWTRDKAGRIKQLWNRSASSAHPKPAVDSSSQQDMRRMHLVHQLYEGFAQGFTCESKEKMEETGAFFASFVTVDSRENFNSDQDHQRFLQNVLKNLDAFNQREECVDLSYKATDELVRFIAKTFGQDEFQPEHILTAVEAAETTGGEKPQSAAGVGIGPRLNHLTRTRPQGPKRAKPSKKLRVNSS
jgi:hypothetical protein